MKNRNGFTLIELLVVITIMGVITVLALPGVEQLQARNRNKRFESYASRMQDAGKLYVDAYSEDMFGITGNGCYDISFQDLYAKSMIKDYTIEGISCNNDKTYVHVERNAGKYTYNVSLYCEKAGNVVYNNIVNKCEDTGMTVMPTIQPNYLSIGGYDGWSKSKDITIKITASAGLNANTSIKYGFSTEIGTIPSNLEQYNFHNALGETELTYKINVSDLDGQYYLFIDGDEVIDKIGHFAQDVWSTETLKFDKTEPTAPTLTNAQNGKWTGASYVNANKYVIAAASSDNVSGIKYYQYRYPSSENIWHTYANSSGTNFTTTPFTNERNEIVEIRACDYADNCSTPAQNMIMIDKTAPTTPVITNVNNNKWVNANYTITVKAKDTASGLASIQYSTNNSTWTNISNSSAEANVEKSAALTISTEGSYNYYARACDNTGNCSNSVSTAIKLDKTKPTCSISLSGTSAGNATYTSNVTVKLNTSNPGASSKSTISYGLASNSTVTYNGLSTATQGQTNGITWYGFIKDAAGNVNSCNSGNFKVSLRTIPEFTYTGSYEIVDNNNNKITDITSWNNDWKIRFLTSGTLTFTDLKSAVNGIDVFLVGGGAGGGSDYWYEIRNGWGGTATGYGGGGGYTKTVKNVTISKGTSYSIVVGSGGGVGGNGGSSSGFGYTANGGAGRNGGSGGGRAAIVYEHSGGSGGTNGGNSSCGTGIGQGTTTREFGESTGNLYSPGGGGGASSAWDGGYASGGSRGAGLTGANSGAGGNGSGGGASGIVIIRNKR